MPFLGSVTGLRPARPWTTYELLSLFQQLLEGIEFLHALQIAHLDLCPGNILAAHPEHARFHDRLVGGKLYIIDFDSSRQLSRGPGKQPSIALPPTQIDPPDGLKHFDPYSWDVYCAAHVMDYIIRMNCAEHTSGILLCYMQWLMGRERGCQGVCECRPTAHKALQMLTLLKTLVYTLGILTHLRCARKASDVRIPV
ncbi:hypothetical protein OH77DRAFT_1431612 [Trametes cingulata]|nr:hypothetical protein OH77DRAFT_1431612 [Trametes cingulata]